MIDVNTLNFPVYDDVAVEGQWFSSFGVYVAGTDGIELSLLPSKEVVKSDVLGIDGSGFSSGRFESREMQLPIYISDVTTIDEFKKIIRFTQPKWIYFKNTNTKIKGIFTNEVNAKSNGREATFTLTLSALDPHFYEIIPFNITYTDFTNPIIFRNSGNVDSFPIYEITGKGKVIVGVNGQVMSINFSATEYETLKLNSKTCEVMMGTTNRLFSLEEVEIPTLLPNQSTIAVTGDCTSLKLTPNSRWI